MPHLSQTKVVFGSTTSSGCGVGQIVRVSIWGEKMGFGDGDEGEDEDADEDEDRDEILLSEYFRSVLRNFGHCGRCSNGRTKRL